MKYNILKGLEDRGVKRVDIYRYKLRHIGVFDKIEGQADKVVIDKLYRAIKDNKHIQVDYHNGGLF